MAAVLAAGEGAALAGLSAAALWRISRWTPDEIHVLAPGNHRRRTGFRLQTCRRLDPRDVTREQGIPVTNVARTLVDLCEILDAPRLANVIHEAAFRHLFDARATRAAMARANGRARLTRLDEALALNSHGSAGTKSELEDRFLAQARAAGLPEPEINVRVAGIEVDFRWGAHIVEVDGGGHARPRTRSDDGKRDERLRAAGYDVVRVSAHDLAAAAPRRSRPARPPRPPPAASPRTSSPQPRRGGARPPGRRDAGIEL